jgi:hypothetical protein
MAISKHKEGVQIVIFLLLAGITSSTHAVIINVTYFDQGAHRLDVLMTEIGNPDDRVYTLDLVNGEVVFGDGRQGARPPSGQDNAVGSYRFGAGNTGAIINIYPIQSGSPLPLIPIVDFIDTISNNNEGPSFIIVGLTSLEFEFSDRGLLVTEAQIGSTGIPEPTILALMGFGLAGIGYRRHRSKKLHNRN